MRIKLKSDAIFPGKPQYLHTAGVAPTSAMPASRNPARKFPGKPAYLHEAGVFAEKPPFPVTGGESCSSPMPAPRSPPPSLILTGKETFPVSARLSCPYGWIPQDSVTGEELYCFQTQPLSSEPAVKGKGKATLSDTSDKSKRSEPPRELPKKRKSKTTLPDTSDQYLPRQDMSTLTSTYEKSFSSLAPSLHNAALSSSSQIPVPYNPPGNLQDKLPFHVTGEESYSFEIRPPSHNATVKAKDKTTLAGTSEQATSFATPPPSKPAVKRKGKTILPHTTDQSNIEIPPPPKASVSRHGKTTLPETSEEAPTTILTTRRGRPIKRPCWMDSSYCHPNNTLVQEELSFQSTMTVSKPVMSSELLEKCNQIISKLFSTKYRTIAWPFYDPIDADYHLLYDYRHIITKPMDLRTVKQKLGNKEYNTAEEFADDIRLIFSNCNKYFPPEHLVTPMAIKVGDLFEQLFQSMCTDISIKSTYLPESTSKSKIKAKANNNSNNKSTNRANTNFNSNPKLNSISHSNSNANPKSQSKLSSSSSSGSGSGSSSGSDSSTGSDYIPGSRSSSSNDSTSDSD